MEERVILVNEKNEVIGNEDKLAAHLKGLCHRAFSIFIFREKVDGVKELLLQQRQFDKYHCGGLWSNTCCGHPRPGEEIVAAGERRLFEEMSLKIKLTHVNIFHYVARLENGLIENEIDSVLIGNYANETIVANSSEVADFVWIELQELNRDISVHPAKYTPWFATALNYADNDK